MPLDVEALSDAELRSELVAAGINAGPITGTTRKIYESKLLKLQKGGSKAKSAKAATPKQTPKPVPKPVATPKITAPSKPKTPAKSLNRTLDTSTRVASSSSRRFNSSEVEDEESDDDEILAPVKTKTPNRKPISSTPTKDVTPVKTVTKEYSSSYSTNRSESPSFHIPNLITDFTPSLSRLSDHPGATPPRKAKSVSRSVTTVFSPQYTPNSFAQKNRFADLGATSAEEDDDDDGVETSRVIYNSNETGPTRRGLVGKAWDKVLGYDFRASTKPGENYDFQTGRTRTSVRKDPRTGMPRVYQTSVVSDWLKIILTSLVILAVLLTIAFVVTQPKETFTSSYAAFKKTVRDTGNFFYRYAILPVISGLVVVALAVGGFFGYKKYKEVKEQEEQELIDLVERIFSIIKDAKNEGEPYVSQPHVRDIIFPPIKRRGADLKRWESAVDFIDKHDSRVTTEVRVTASGNECPVWIWVGVETKGKRYH